MNFAAVDDEDGSEPNMTPLIDVVFQLLIFFVLTMTYAVQSELLLPVELARARAGMTPGEEAFTGVTITVTADGLAVVDGDEPLLDEELGAHLREVKRDRADARVLIRGDRAASHGRMIEVLGLVTRIGFARVDFVVTRPR